MCSFRCRWHPNSERHTLNKWQYGPIGPANFLDIRTHIWNMDKIEVKRRDQGCKSVTYLTNKLKHKSRCSWFTGVVAPIQDLWVVLTMCRIRSGHHYECIIGTPRVLINSCTSHLPFIGLTHFKLFRHAINSSFKENKWVIFCLCYLINFCLPSSLMLS